MMFENVADLCRQRGTNITALCKEVTGSTGNLPAWKKDVFRPDQIIKICQKFNVSADTLLLGHPVTLGLEASEVILITHFRTLDDEGKTIVQDALISEQRRMAGLNDAT